MGTLLNGRREDGSKEKEGAENEEKDGEGTCPMRNTMRSN